MCNDAAAELTALARSLRGTAAVEFALVSVVLLTMLGGLVDFGLMLWTKNRLAGGVAAGAQYAFDTWPTVGSGTMAQYRASIRSVVQATSSLSPVNVTVTPLICYCISGTPATLSASATCKVTCPDGTPPGSYIGIVANYTYHPIMPYYSALANATLQESATARVQ